MSLIGKLCEVLALQDSPLSFYYSSLKYIIAGCFHSTTGVVWGFTEFNPFAGYVRSFKF